MELIYKEQLLMVTKITGLKELECSEPKKLRKKAIKTAKIKP